MEISVNNVMFTLRVSHFNTRLVGLGPAHVECLPSSLIFIRSHLLPEPSSLLHVSLCIPTTTNHNGMIVGERFRNSIFPKAVNAMIKRNKDNSTFYGASLVNRPMK